MTWMAYTLALAWLISYACFLWVESVPTQLPCAWGIHGCAPHTLCEAEWPPSLFSRPTCEQLAPRTLPRNHPPVPAGAGAGGLCAAALASMGAARCRNQGPPDRPEWRRAGFSSARDCPSGTWCGQPRPISRFGRAGTQALSALGPTLASPWPHLGLDTGVCTRAAPPPIGRDTRRHPRCESRVRRGLPAARRGRGSDHRVSAGVNEPTSWPGDCGNHEQTCVWAVHRWGIISSVYCRNDMQCYRLGWP